MDENLSRAIVLFVHYGTSRFPRDDPEAVLKAYEGNTGISLLAAIRAILAEPMPDDIKTESSLARIGAMVIAAIRKRHPALSEQALKALAWRYTFQSR